MTNTQSLRDPSAEARATVVQAGSELVRLGLSPGKSGNISVRHKDRVYLSPTGVALSELVAEELAVTTLAGKHIDGRAPSKEFPLHLAMYRRSDETTAVVHLHSLYAVAASTLQPWHQFSALPPLTPYMVMRVGQIPLINYAQPGDTSQAMAIEQHPLSFSCLLLQNHGSVTSGPSMAKAVDAAVELEEAAKLRILTAELPHNSLTNAQASQLADKYASDWSINDEEFEDYSMP